MTTYRVMRKEISKNLEFIKRKFARIMITK